MKNINGYKIIITNRIDNLERSYRVNRLQFLTEKYKILFDGNKSVSKICEYDLYTGKKKVECITTVTFSVKELCHAKLG